MVMFLNAPFCREAAALSGLSDEPDCLKPFAKNFWRGVLPRWQPPDRTEHLETSPFLKLEPKTHIQPAPGGRKNPAPGLIPHQRERDPVTVPFIRPPPTAYNLQFYITTLLQLLQLLLPLHSDLLKLLDRPRNLRQRLRLIRTDIIQRRNRIRKRLL